MKSLSDCYKLSNGVEIPCVAYGTYLTPAGDVCADGVKCALLSGYRHIDTAEFYKNEESVGEGIRASGIKRADIFITTKVWNTNQGYNETLKAFDKSMDRLGLEQLDLYLIHWPTPLKFRDTYPKKFVETWRALEQLYKDGRVRAIGVCNCLPHHLKALFGECEIKPMVDQIELHPGYIQVEAAAFAQANNMVVEAWAPLCRGRAFGKEPLKTIAEKYKKTEAQVLVRWSLQHGWLPLPKSVTPERIVENAQVFDFDISKTDMRALDLFEGSGRIGSHPDEANF